MFSSARRAHASLLKADESRWYYYGVAWAGFIGMWAAAWSGATWYIDNHMRNKPDLRLIPKKQQKKPQDPTAGGWL